MRGRLVRTTSCYVVQRRPATGWPPRRAPQVTRNLITGIVGLPQNLLRGLLLPANFSRGSLFSVAGADRPRLAVHSTVQSATDRSDRGSPNDHRTARCPPGGALCQRIERRGTVSANPARAIAKAAPAHRRRQGPCVTRRVREQDRHCPPCAARLPRFHGGVDSSNTASGQAATMRHDHMCPFRAQKWMKFVENLKMLRHRKNRQCPISRHKALFFTQLPFHGWCNWCARREGWGSHEEASGGRAKSCLARSETGGGTEDRRVTCFDDGSHGFGWRGDVGGSFGSARICSNTGKSSRKVRDIGCRCPISAGAGESLRQAGGGVIRADGKLDNVGERQRITDYGVVGGAGPVQGRRQVALGGP